jgi:hypothetical protein
MTPGDLVITQSFPLLTVGCCPNKIYAILFNEDMQALKLDAGVWSFAAYDQEDSGFAIPMAEDAERTMTYQSIINSGFHTLPVTPPGRHYFIEFWRRTLSDSLLSRSEDTLMQCERCYWDGDGLAYSRLSSSDVTSVAKNEALVNYAYDSSDNSINMLCFLNTNGRLRTDVNRCEVLWTKRDGSPIAHIVKTSTISGMDGFFAIDIPLTDLSPDLCTPIKVTIRDSSGESHTTGQASVTWD